MATYVVTGANRGIGLELVAQLVAQGHHVLATARQPERAEALSALSSEHPGQIEVFALDVSDPASVTAFGQAVGDRPVDVLINNAGVLLRGGGPGELDYEKIELTFRINTLGPLRVTEALLPALRAAAQPVIANITSQMGSIADNTSGGAYSYRISKAALNMAIRSLALDLGRQGMVALVLHPGWVQTDMGGPNAKITTTQSVTGMLSTIQSATAEHAGKFWNWDGTELPW